MGDDINNMFQATSEVDLELPRALSAVAFRQDPVIIELKGEVEETDVQSVREAINRARTIEQRLVPFFIDSYGGECYSAVAIVDLMREFERSGGIIATHCGSKAMSAANLILSNGTAGHRTMGPNATLMFHHANQTHFGTTSAPEYVNDAMELVRLNKQTRDLMAERTELSSDEWKQYLKHKGRNAAVFIDAATAVTLGLVDKIGVPQFKATVAVTYDFAPVGGFDDQTPYITKHTVADLLKFEDSDDEDLDTKKKKKRTLKQVEGSDMDD